MNTAACRLWVATAVLLTTGSGAFWFSMQAGNKSAYLRIRSAPLFSKPDNKQPLDTLVQMGEKFELLETKGAWVRVKATLKSNAKTVEGWLPSAWTSEQPPVLETTPAKVAAETPSTVQTKILTFTAARGGDAEQVKALWARQEKIVDKDAFQKDGKLGSYRVDDAFPLEGAAK